MSANDVPTLQNRL